MNTLLSALSSDTVLAIVVTCLVLIGLVVFIVLSILQKKNKLTGNTASHMSRINGRLSSFGEMVRLKMIENPVKGEVALYWTVVVLEVAGASLYLVCEILNKTYSLNFLKMIVYLAFIVFMIVFHIRYAPNVPYYYEYDPMLFSYSVLALFFALIDFVTGLVNGSVIFSLLYFVGNLLFFGIIFITRFSKDEFKLRSLLVYLGAIIIGITDIINFCVYVPSNPLVLIMTLIRTLASIALNVLLLYFYDDFDFIKKLFRK